MSKVIIKLGHTYSVLKSNEGQNLNKVVSSISPKSFIRLMEVIDNKINPRTAKVGPITKAIYETLDTTPELFWFKSKGMLISTTALRRLDRDRVELRFDMPEFEGIMDGGHNALAIANFITKKLMNVAFKDWEQCKGFWQDNCEAIAEKFNEAEKEQPDMFRFSIPIEILAPAPENGAQSDFYDAIADICAARNNNVQLRPTAKDNQEGYYDYLRTKLKKYPIIWRTNEVGQIKVEDVVTMACIPLMVLQSKGLTAYDKKLNPVSLYSGKGQCIAFFRGIIENDELTEARDGKIIIGSPLLKSALDMTETILNFFDRVLLAFPDMYNKACRGRFGSIGAVKTDKKMKTLFCTTTQACEYSYPHAFFYPLIAGMVSLIKYNAELNSLEWTTDPSNINPYDLDLNRYTEMMRILQFNPNTIGKTTLMYDISQDAYKRFV